MSKSIEYIPNKDLFTLSLCDDNKRFGSVYIERDKIKTICWLDLFVLEEYRGKWLTKQFASFLITKLIECCYEHKIEYILTAILNPKSKRLVDFFGFEQYNNKCYYLDVNYYYQLLKKEK